MSTKSLSILLVEDDPIQQRAMQSLLETMQHEVTVAKNGKEALNKLLFPHDLILIDIGLPHDFNGIEVAKSIRKQHISTWIVAVTAHLASYSKQQCLASGMNDFMTKPITSEKILQITKKRKAQH